jgi:hypothetical protein
MGLILDSVLLERTHRKTIQGEKRDFEKGHVKRERERS